MTGSLSRGDITLSNWRVHPYSRWSFQNVAEIVPSAVAAWPRGEEEEGPGEAALAELRLAGMDGARIAARDYLAFSHTDSFVAMRDGRIVAEWNAPHCDPLAPHLLFSISKSITGLLAGIAVAEGSLDPEAPVARHAAAASGPAYSGARIRDLLDMTVDVDFDEEYVDADGQFDRYRRAMLWNPERPGAQAETMESFLASLGTVQGRHGERFFYASPNTDILGLSIERATGMRYHDCLAQLLWLPMGARGPALVTVDREGTARAAGGISATVRDLARLGQLLLDDGRSGDGRQVVPEEWLRDLRENGNRRAWEKGNFAELFPKGRYRSGWYDTGDGRGSFCAIGIHGQWLWIDPTAGIALARTASCPQASDDDDNAREISMLGQLARLL